MTVADQHNALDYLPYDNSLKKFVSSFGGYGANSQYCVFAASSGQRSISLLQQTQDYTEKVIMRPISRDESALWAQKYGIGDVQSHPLWRELYDISGGVILKMEQVIKEAGADIMGHLTENLLLDVHGKMGKANVSRVGGVLSA